MSELLGKMAESLIAGKIDEVVDLTKEALDGERHRRIYWIRGC